MLVSFDGLAAFRPPQVDGAWATREALEWLHVDQGSTKRGLAGVQGALLLYDQDAASGGFVCLPRSHLRHEALVPPHRAKDYVRFKADDARLDGLGDARLVCAAAGDLVLWDSRTVHCSQPADARAPLPVEPDAARPPGGASSSAGVPRLSRLACLICMVPAEPHLATATGPSLVATRAEYVDAGVTTTHWPQETVRVSQGPAPGMGVGSVAKLPPEAQALVRGSKCFQRHTFRRRLPEEA